MRPMLLFLAVATAPIEGPDKIAESPKEIAKEEAVFVPFNPPMAPPLPLSTLLPITLSEQNREAGKQPQEAILRPHPPFVLLLFFVLLAALPLLRQLVLAIKKRIPPRPVRFSAKEKAHKALAALYKKSVDTPEEYPSYHAKASAIIRLYLEEVSGVQASTMTTPELIACSEQISPSQKRAIIEFFTALDRLNFAACSITEEDFRRTYREAEKIVDHI